MQKKLRRNFLKSNIDGLKILFKVYPMGMIFYILGSAIHGLSWGLEILCMQYFFDTVARAADGKETYAKVLIWLFIMGASYAFSQFMNGIFNCYSQICNQRISQNMNELLFKRINAMELEEYEEVNALECLDRAVNGSKYLFWVCTTVLDLFFYYGVYFIFVGSYMVRLKPILGISIVLIFIPCLFSKIVNYYIFDEKEEKATSVRRYAQYYEKCLTNKECVKETRLLGAGKYFYCLYKDKLEKYGEIEWKAQKRKNFFELITSTVTVICYCIILYMLFVFVMNETISVGAFAAVLGSLSRIYSNMDEIISERIGWASENVASVNNFLEFVLNIKDGKRKVSIENFKEITLNNVSFTYPGATAPAIKSICLQLKKGETVAIVGQNGSGKTTLCKLIMGLYIPNSGIVRFDDISSENIQYNGISAVFQNYCRYQMCLRENIKISEVQKEVSKESIVVLCNQVGISLEKGTYPRGIETMLGTDFGGVDLSGGQWQRVSLARGLYRNHTFIVLDEPTAALDPLEESRVYWQFGQMCKNKTAIIVTHRLASSKIADRIIVMKDGEIVQEGSFEELSTTEGEYRRMYLEQKKWYENQ